MELWIDEGRGGGFERREIPSGGLPLASGRAREPIAALVPFAERGRPGVALVLGAAPGRVLLNGFPPLPLSVLEDRDEILIEGQRLQLVALAEPSVLRLEPSGAGAACGRCRRELCAGDEVVLCPLCGTPHHEGERAAPGASALLCWSYDRSCAGPCRRRRAELAFRPDGAEEER